MIERYGADALRYYLLREVAFGSGRRLGYDALHAALPRRPGQRPGQPVSAHGRDDRPLPRRRGAAGADGAGDRRAGSTTSPPASTRAFERLDFTGALERVWELVRALNRYVEEQAPWELAQSDEASAAQLDETLATLAEGVRVLGVLLWPFLP